MSVPDWLRPLAAVAGSVTGDDLGRFAPPAHGGRRAAVLALFGEGAEGPDILLIQRATTLRSHAGQPAFPGGALDADDVDAAAAALREGAEETGLDPSGVDVIAELPDLWLAPSGFVVTPVLGWWRRPSAVRAVDAAEVARVVRVPITELTDPANRCRVRHPSGYIGAAFTVRDLLVWGFTGGLLDRLLVLGGFDRPWNHDRIVELPARDRELAVRERVRHGRALPDLPVDRRPVG